MDTELPAATPADTDATSAPSEADALKRLIGAALEGCTDLSLLDLVYKLLIVS